METIGGIVIIILALFLGGYGTKVLYSNFKEKTLTGFHIITLLAVLMCIFAIIATTIKII